MYGARLKSEIKQYISAIKSATFLLRLMERIHRRNKKYISVLRLEVSGRTLQLNCFQFVIYSFIQI
jgi:hypothetical protein